MSTAQQRRASRTDAIGHSSVQPWSAGDIFPFVMVRVESTHFRTQWYATNGPEGAETCSFDSYDEAHQAAKRALCEQQIRAYRKRHPEIVEAWRVQAPAGPVLADGLVPAEAGARPVGKHPALGADYGVMCGGDADATAADLNETRIEAIPRLAREFVDLTPEARSRLMEKSRKELFADAEANPADQRTVLE